MKRRVRRKRDTSPPYRQVDYQGGRSGNDSHRFDALKSADGPTVLGGPRAPSRVGTTPSTSTNVHLLTRPASGGARRLAGSISGHLEASPRERPKPPWFVLVCPTRR